MYMVNIIYIITSMNKYIYIYIQYQSKIQKKAQSPSKSSRTKPKTKPKHRDQNHNKKSSLSHGRSNHNQKADLLSNPISLLSQNANGSSSSSDIEILNEIQKSHSKKGTQSKSGSTDGKLSDVTVDAILSTKYKWDAADKADKGEETFGERRKRKFKSKRRRYYREHSYSKARETDGARPMQRAILRKFKMILVEEVFYKQADDFRKQCLLMNPVTFYAVLHKYSFTPEMFFIPQEDPTSEEYQSMNNIYFYYLPLNIHYQINYIIFI